MSKFTGFLTHLKRETIRFFTVPNNTVVPALIRTFLFMLIFGVGIGRTISLPEFDYLEFLVPGLIMMNVINGSYSNPSGSLFMSRFLKHIEDLLTSPLSYAEMTLAYVMGGMARGVTLGFGSWVIALPFVIIPAKNPLVLLLFLLLTSIVFACFGILVGLWAEEFEQLNLFLNFLITPLTFLGGVFYSIQQVPEALATITKFNPLFYMINGVRYGLIGYTEASLWMGGAILTVLAVALFFLCHHLFKIGWHLRD